MNNDNRKLLHRALNQLENSIDILMLLDESIDDSKIKDSLYALTNDLTVSENYLRRIYQEVLENA